MYWHYLLLKTLHVIGGAVLLGTGIGIAFFMVLAHRTRNPLIVAHTVGVVVIADALFVATTLLWQPITGALMAVAYLYDWYAPWLAISLILYVVAGAFWLPILWLDWRIRNLAREAVAAHALLPPLYHRLYAIRFAIGIPAFSAVIAIFWLMIAQPA